MCSIAGYLGRKVDHGRGFVERANRLMLHRGPNDGGVFVGSQVVLGSRRLSILDLTPAGHQPMISPDGRWILVFNGEIYNHIQLRARHCKNWPFRGCCDTETLLAVLAELGVAALDQLVGMWSFALWDTVEERLLLSRDRYGQKPLYWRSDVDGSVRFASEIKPLLEENEKAVCNPTAIAEYLALGNYDHLQDETFFREIHSFPPGHWAWVAPGDTPRAYRYWRFPTVPMRERRPLTAEITQHFRSKLEDAVRSQLLADVNVGMTLSGGLDSSSIAGLVASNESCRPLPVFTAQVTGSKYDESRYVRSVEEKWCGRLQVNWIPLASMALENCLKKTVRIQEEPFGDPSILAHGQLMDAAQSLNVPVILGGQGGDELLFGYSWMSAALLASGLRHRSTSWAQKEMHQQNLTTATIARIYTAAFAPRLERFVRRSSRVAKRHWLSRSLRQTASQEIAQGSMSDIVNAQLEAVEQFCIPHLTHYDDRNAMARSIESRMPFLDHRLAEILAELHPSAFLSGSATKYILREACGDILPPMVRQRRDKVGFFTPLERMMHKENEWVKSVVLDERARQLNFYDIHEVQRSAHICASRIGDSQAALRLWRCLVVRTWAEEFNVQPILPT